MTEDKVSGVFDEILNFILVELEGGGTFHRVEGDPGGATKWGVSLRFLKGVYPEATEEDIGNLTYDGAYKLYVAHFWLQVKGPSLPAKIAPIVLDQAINQGVGAARKDLREALGLVPMAQALTPEVIFEARRQDPTKVIKRLFQLRLTRYKMTRGWDRFGKGWKNRLKRLAVFLKIKPLDLPFDLQ